MKCNVGQKHTIGRLGHDDLGSSDTGHDVVKGYELRIRSKRNVLIRELVEIQPQGKYIYSSQLILISPAGRY